VDFESRLALEADEPAVATFLEQHDGRLHRLHEEPDEGVRWLELTPVKAPDERYFARLSWTVYPHQPPSVVFTFGATHSQGPGAWPQIPGYRPSENDICKHFTAEGYRIHPDWAQGPSAWVSTGNRFLYVAETLQDDLDLHYQGRAA
jgi:hypothetical protein